MIHNKVFGQSSHGISVRLFFYEIWPAVTNNSQCVHQVLNRICATPTADTLDFLDTPCGRWTSNALMNLKRNLCFVPADWSLCFMLTHKNLLWPWYCRGMSLTCHCSNPGLIPNVSIYSVVVPHSRLFESSGFFCFLHQGRPDKCQHLGLQEHVLLCLVSFCIIKVK